MRAWQHFRALLGHEPWHIELWSAVGVLLMSAWSGLGPADLQGNSNWRYLSLLVSDDCFDAATLLLAVAQLAAVSLDHKWGRMIMAFCAALFWFTMARSLWLGNPTSVGVVPFLTLGLQNLASVLLIRLRPANRLHDA